VIETAARGEDASLVQWRTTDWSRQAPTPLADLVDRKSVATSFPVLTSQMLFLLSVIQVGEESSKLQIASAQLLERDYRPRPFASMIVPRIEWNTVRSALMNPEKQDWHVAPSGNCLVSPPVFPGRWAIMRQATAPLKIRTTFLGFLPEGENGVTSELASRRVFKQHGLRESPPFWDHLKTSGFQYRIAIVDFATGQLAARSQWWACSRPQLSASKDLVFARESSDDNRLLLWETPVAVE
jgi:hypothetical protein